VPTIFRLFSRAENNTTHRVFLDQSTYHFITYFHCSVPASKWKYRHAQYCSNKY